MWQRFTERARKVVFYAQEEAQKFGEGYVSTEHLLLGLMRESDSVAVRVLEKLMMSPGRVRAEVEKLVPAAGPKPHLDMTLTPRAKRVIDLSYDEARNLNNNYIGTEHLLLGLVREADGIAGRVLLNLGLELEAVRSAVIEIQGSEGRPAAPAPQRRASLLRSEQEPAPGSSASPTAGRKATGLWWRFNDEARRVVFLAQEEAQRFGEGYVSTEHLLLGVTLQPESLAVRALEKLSVSVNRIRGEVERQLPKGDPGPARDITLTPRAKRVIEMASEEASTPHGGQIGSEHVLLGLVLEGDGLAGRVLAKLGVRVEPLRRVVTEMRKTAQAEPEGRLEQLAESIVEESRDRAAQANYVDPLVAFQQVAESVLGTSRHRAGLRLVSSFWSSLDRSAKVAILQAQMEAQRWNQDKVGVVDLMLGLLDAPGDPLSGLLASLGRSTAEVRVAVEAGLPTELPSLLGIVTMSNDASEAICAAVKEADGSPSVTAGHLLLGVLTFEEYVPAKTFAAMGITIEQVRAAVRQ